MAKASTAQTEKKSNRGGRTPKADRDFIVLKNGLYAGQWKWLQEEARNKVPPVDAAEVLRYIVQAGIEQIEKSRTPINEIVKPEDDAEFEKLIETSKKKQTKSKQTKTKHKEK